VPGSSPTYLTLAPWSRVKSDGSVVDAPVTPHALVLVPTAEAQNAYENACAACLDFRDRLATLVPETTLYDIYTKETKESKAELWGKLVLTTGFKASAYGDNQLFFRHHLE